MPDSWGSGVGGSKTRLYLAKWGLNRGHIWGFGRLRRLSMPCSASDKGLASSCFLSSLRLSKEGDKSRVYLSKPKTSPKEEAGGRPRLFPSGQV